MTLDELKKLPMADLLALYNTMAEKQVKRFESRVKAEERTKQLLRDKGELVDEKVTGLTDTDTGAKNVRQTAEAGVKTGDRATKKTKATTKPAPKEKAKKEKPAPAPKPVKKAAPAAKEKASAAAARQRGAPTKNPSYTAIPETSKKYNPDKLKLQASSARFLVLEEIRKASGVKTRDKLTAKFPDSNVKSALDVLVRYGFITVDAEQ